MKLFHRSGAGRPIRVRWALEEAGIEHEVRVMDAAESRSDEHRGRHPLGRVPVLDDGDGPIFESAAIVLHVADLAGDALTFPVGSHERALVYQWVLFAVTEVEPRIVGQMRTKDEDRIAAEAEGFGRVLAVLERALGGERHLVGDRFTAADLVVVDVLLIARRVLDAEYSPAISDYVAEHRGRPGRARAEELSTA